MMKWVRKPLTGAAALGVALALTLAGSGWALAGESLESPQAPGPQDVDLEYFIGQAFSGYIHLEWSTVQEDPSLAAFRLRRATVNDYTQGIVVTPTPIQAHPEQSWAYDYQDTYNLVPGTTYYYWLEDVGTSGPWYTNEDYVPVVPYCSRYDIDCSQAVDAVDIGLVAGAWGCSVFDPCYQERLDLDLDYFITAEDIRQVAEYWPCKWADGCYWN